MFGFNNSYNSPHQYQMDASIYRRHRPLQTTVVNEWKPTGSYVQRSIQPWQIQHVGESEVVKTYLSPSDYSSTEKMFYGPVPYNTQTYNYACVSGNFDVSRLPQTNILDVISTNSRDRYKLMGPYEVSLSNTLSKVFRSVGAIKDSYGNCLGTGTLISNNFILIARHSIEGLDVRTLNAVFEDFKIQGHGYTQGSKYEVDYVVESNSHLDYAIVKLKGNPGKKHGYVSFGKNTYPVSEPALLHYPLGKPLQVSVHTFTQTQYKSNWLQTYHDSDYNSSGGAYIDPSGFLVAMHLGSELNRYNMNLCRYAISIQEIINQNLDGVLSKFSDGRLDQAKSYKSQRQKYNLTPIRRSFIIDEEIGKGMIKKGAILNESDFGFYPMGFTNFNDFKEFMKCLYCGLKNDAKKHFKNGDLTFVFHGSSITGESYKDKGTGRDFDDGRVSDYDMTIVSWKLFDACNRYGIKVRGNHSEPLTQEQMITLGLNSSRIRAEAYVLQNQIKNREVNFMLYPSIDEATKHEGGALKCYIINKTLYTEALGNLGGIHK